MTTAAEIAHLRLQKQGITDARFATPQAVVHWLGAVQAQDIAGAKWSIALRGQRITEAAIDKALDEGSILRTHVMRPTWHFVASADFRWLLELTAPRVQAGNAYMYRRLELDAPTLKRGNVALEKALHGGRQLTRTEIASVFAKTGITAAGLRLGYFLMHAELDGVICSGSIRGKQQTYTLLSERTPQAPRLSREEALVDALTVLFHESWPSHGLGLRLVVGADPGGREGRSRDGELRAGA